MKPHIIQEKNHKNQNEKVQKVFLGRTSQKCPFSFSPNDFLKKALQKTISKHNAANPEIPTKNNTASNININLRKSI